MSNKNLKYYLGKYFIDYCEKHNITPNTDGVGFEMWICGDTDNIQDLLDSYDVDGVIPRESVYVLQTNVCRDYNWPIYKIGQTTRPIHKRLNEYQEGSLLMGCIPVENALLCERKLKKKFINKYKRIKALGNEYFMGDIREIIKDLKKYSQF